MTLVLIGALVIGLSLGLLGSGGSILTVPVLVYILHRPEKLAVAESLAIVGCIACVGSVHYALKNSVHWKSILFFGIPGMLGAYFGACGSYYVSGSIQMTLFAIVMLTAAGIMFFGPTSFESFKPSKFPLIITMLEGFCVGSLTGFIGIGGGFLIVPALVMLSNLTMLFAIGTSLMIIAMNAFTGFTEQLIALHALDLEVNWGIIAMISSIGILGSLAGSSLAKRMSQMRLRKIFAISILIMGIYILLKQIY